MHRGCPTAAAAQWLPHATRSPVVTFTAIQRLRQSVLRSRPGFRGDEVLLAEVRSDGPADPLGPLPPPEPATGRRLHPASARGTRAGHRCQGPQRDGTAVSQCFDLDGLFTSRGGADGVDWVHLRRGRPPTRAREAPALVRRPGSRPADPRVRDGGVLRVWRIVLGRSAAMPSMRLRRAEAARRCRGRFLAHV
jgi:hypothetical protein